MVCDAFFNVGRVTGPVGLVMRSLKGGPGLSIGQTFSWVALKDRRAYRAWILEALARERPTELWMSHGDTVTRGDLTEVLAALVKARV